MTPPALRRVCHTYFRWVLVYSRHGVTTLSRPWHRQVRSSRSEPVKAAVTRWLKQEARYAEAMPDQAQTHLPFPNKISTYRAFLRDMIRDGTPDLACRIDYFRRVWREGDDTKRFKVRKWIRFAKCDVCVAYRADVSKTKDEAALTALAADFRSHIQDVKDERGAYYERRDLGASRPDEYLSIIIDGADQQRFALPWFRELSHDTMNLYRLRLGLHGLLAHGDGAYTFTALPDQKQGTNATTEVIHRYLMHRHSRGLKLPPWVFIQLDNTSKSNKNRYLIGFLAYLIAMGVCEGFVVSFLMVGHTHEDIDQFFSRLAVAMRQTDAHSRLALSRIIENAVQVNTRSQVDKTKRVQAAQSRPITANMDRLANMSEYLEPHLGNFDGIMQWRQFKICWHPPDSTSSVRYVGVSGAATSHRRGTETQYYRGLNSKWSWATPVFNTNAGTQDFLSRPAFTGPIPNTQRKRDGADESARSKQTGTQTRVNKDVETAIKLKAMSQADADDLRECTRLCGDEAEDKDFEFAWDVSYYRAQQTALAKNRDDEPRAPTIIERELAEATKMHPVQTFVLVSLQASEEQEYPFAVAKILEWAIRKSEADDSSNAEAKVSWYEVTNHLTSKYDRTKPQTWVWKPCTAQGPESEKWVYKQGIQGGNLGSGQTLLKYTKSDKGYKLSGGKDGGAQIWSFWEDFLKSSEQERSVLEDGGAIGGDSDVEGD